MWFSIWIGFRRTLGAPGGVFGWIIASVSLFNLVSSLARLPLSTIVTEVLRYYRGVMHRFVDFLILPFDLSLSPAGKDLLILYCVMGGVLMRFMELDEARAALRYTFRGAFEKISNAPFFAITLMPTPVRQILTLGFWPFFLPTLVYVSPYIIYSRDTDGNNTRWKATGTYIGEGRPHDGVWHDKRIVFYTSVALTICGMFLLFALNAFTMPSV